LPSGGGILLYATNANWSSMFSFTAKDKV
jgi:hypothetical protein